VPKVYADQPGYCYIRVDEIAASLFPDDPARLRIESARGFKVRKGGKNVHEVEICRHFHSRREEVSEPRTVRTAIVEY
jgi:predicted ABC-type ATPase